MEPMKCRECGLSGFNDFGTREAGLCDKCLLRSKLAAAGARIEALEAQIAASKQNERRWIAKGEEAIAERNAANKALEAIKKHQEIVAGTGTAQMSTTWKIADAHLRSIGTARAARAALAATEVSA